MRNAEMDVDRVADLPTKADGNIDLFGLSRDELVTIILGYREDFTAQVQEHAMEIAKAAVQDVAAKVAAECDHMRMRARQLLAGEIAPQHLANSVILHTNNISREE